MEEKDIYLPLHIAELIYRQRFSVLRDEEAELLTNWLAENESNRLLFHELNQENLIAETLKELELAPLQGSFERVYQATGMTFKRRHPVRVLARRWKAAAAIFILIATGSYLWFSQRGNKQLAGISNIKELKNDVAPGGNKANLRLSNGATIVLDSIHNGQVISQGNVHVVKVNNGLLVYNPAPGASTLNMIQYNTLTTPRGGQYRLKLPDGTDVWLNAASSIRYPTAFAGKERKVEITGEVYFEVAPDPSASFKVIAGKVQVEVLGTHFNINAYQDEASLKTTLLEGSLRVTQSDALPANRQSQLLIPGDQAQVGETGQIRVLKDVDVDEAVAWKNGYFSFDNADLQTVMRQLSRWYDVDVYYQGAIPRKRFGGEILRNLSLSQALMVLDKSHIRFKIEGKKLIINP